MFNINSNNLNLQNSLVLKNSYHKTLKPKKKILCWSDSCIATTGFGVVSNNILRSLYLTGNYEIDQLAINFTGEFYNKEEYPYNIIPSRLKNPRDPYGNAMLLEALQKKDYDILFIINDTFVTEAVAREIPKIFDSRKKSGKKIPKIVYYYPVDCRFIPHAQSMFNLADYPIAYTNFTYSETVKITNKKPYKVIYHGVDTNIYHPINSEERKLYRQQYLKVEDDSTFIWINCNRNSIRKDLPRTILAFSEFKKKIPNSKLYLHTVIKDGTGGALITDLNVPLQELGLDPTKDVLFPNQQRYSAANGFPAPLLNMLYNCSNGYLSTALGEGFGLTQVEAMSAGIPVVVGNHTSSPEIVGNDRGYMYECKEKIFIDNSGYRKFAHIEDILKQMMNCYNDWKSSSARRQLIISKARKFAEKYSWSNVCKEWIKLFDSIEAYHYDANSNSNINGELV